MKPNVGPVVAIVAGALFAIAIGCAGGAQKSAPSSQTMPSVAPAGPNQSPEHQQIAALDKQIADELAGMGMTAPAPRSCAANGCGTTAPQSMSVKPFGQDPACRAPSSETCKSSCTLSDSICGNADRICELAKQLGGNDAYANDKCAHGAASCESAHARCCSCTL